MKRLFFLGFMFVIVIGSAVSAQSEMPEPDRAAQIVGGREAAPGAWPWMASVMSRGVSNGYSAHFCGGSLISAEWVLTASHCVIGEQANNIDVTVGRHVLSSNSGQRVAVSQIIMHPQYNDNTLDYDIALLKLSQPISNISPVTLVRTPTNGIDASGKSATVMGWGALASGGGSPDPLHQVSVPLISQDACNSAYNGGITGRMICAGLLNVGGKDACQGDSGGPLVVRDSADSGWQQVGIVSWGFGCASPEHPGVYARISVLVDWIESHTGALKEPIDLSTLTNKVYVPIVVR